RSRSNRSVTEDRSAGPSFLSSTAPHAATAFRPLNEKLKLGSIDSEDAHIAGHWKGIDRPNVTQDPSVVGRRGLATSSPRIARRKMADIQQIHDGNRNPDRIVPMRPFRGTDEQRPS